MTTPFITPVTEGSVAESDRQNHIEVITLDNDLNMVTSKLIPIEAILELVKALDIASAPSANHSLIYDGSSLTWALVNVANLHATVVARLVRSGGSAGDVYGIAADGTTREWRPESGGATNLSVGARTATTLIIASDTGNNATLPSASATEAGLQAAADKAKVDGLDTARQMPPGGTTGQALFKRSGNDFETEWRPVSAGTTQTLSGAILSAVDDATTADVIIAEPSAAATWSDWVDLRVYTATAAGRHFVSGQLHGMLEKTEDGSTWVEFVPTGGGDRAGAELRLLYQTAGNLGEVFNYVRNVPSTQLTDVDEVFDLMTSQVTAASGATIKLQARYQQQLVGTQGNVGDAHRRTAGRLRFPSGDVVLRITNFGEVTATAPTHQVYMVFGTTSAIPTPTEFQAGISSTTGSTVVTGQPQTTDLRYVNIWSAEQLQSLTFANNAPDPNEDQLPQLTAGRLVINGVNGYTYTGWAVYAETLNTTIAWTT